MYDFYLIDSDSNPVLLDENQPAGPNALLDSMAPGIYNFVVTKAGEAPQAGAFKQKHWVVGPAATPTVEYGKNELTINFERPDFSRRTRVIMQEGADGPGRTVLAGAKASYTSTDPAMDRFRIQGEGLTPAATGQVSDWVIAPAVEISDVILNTPVRNPDGTVTLTWTGGDTTGGLPVYYDIEVLSEEDMQLIPVPLEDGKTYTFPLSEAASLRVRAYCGFAMVSSEVFTLFTNVKKVFAGHGGSSYAIMDNGELYVCGQNNRGQLGLGPAASNMIPYYQKVNGITGIIDGDATENVSVILCANGDVWGAGDLYVAGLSNEYPSATISPSPYFWKMWDAAARGAKATKISLCASPNSPDNGNLLVVLNDGTLWGCGRNRESHLGNGNATVQYSFVKVYNGTAKVLDAFVSNRHSIIRTDAPALLTAGFNGSGRTGLNKSTSDITATWSVMANSSTLHPIKQFGIWAVGCYVLTEAGVLYTCGNNVDGATAQATNTGTTNVLTPVKTWHISAKCLKVWSSPYENSLFGGFSTTSDLLTLAGWGANDQRQLGNAYPPSSPITTVTPCIFSRSTYLAELENINIITKAKTSWVAVKDTQGVRIYSAGSNVNNKINSSSESPIIGFIENSESPYITANSLEMAASAASHFIGIRETDVGMLPVACGNNAGGALGLNSTGTITGGNHPASGNTGDIAIPSQGINPTIVITRTSTLPTNRQLLVSFWSPVSFGTTYSVMRLRDGSSTEILTGNIDTAQPTSNPLGMIVDLPAAELQKDDIIWVTSGLTDSTAIISNAINFDNLESEPEEPLEDLTLKFTATGAVPIDTISPYKYVRFTVFQGGGGGGAGGAGGYISYGGSAGARAQIYTAPDNIVLGSVNTGMSNGGNGLVGELGDYGGYWGAGGGGGGTAGASGDMVDDYYGIVSADNGGAASIVERNTTQKQWISFDDSPAGGQGGRGGTGAWPETNGGSGATGWRISGLMLVSELLKSPAPASIQVIINTGGGGGVTSYPGGAINHGGNGQAAKAVIQLSDNQNIPILSYEEI